MQENAGFDARVGVRSAVRGALAAAALAAAFQGHWEVVCRDKDGVEKWRDTIDNIVVNEGLDYILDAGLSGGTVDTSWFIGLTSASPTIAAGNTLASHAGWTEVTAYDEASRQAWVDGGVSGQSVSNAGTPAVFTINADTTDVGGAFLCGVASGTSGILYAAGAFTAGNKSLDDNDTLEVTFTATATAA